MLRKARGASPRQKGVRNERKAARELNRHLTSLHARRTPGSGSLSHRFDDCQDPHFAGDIQVRRADNSIVEYVEVKVRDPAKKAITIAQMDKWRTDRRILMCRHDRGRWLCSMWAPVWDELCEKAGGEPPLLDTRDFGGRTRGVTIPQIQEKTGMYLGFAVFWGAAIYMNPPTFCELLEAAYAEAE